MQIQMQTQMQIQIQIQIQHCIQPGFWEFSQKVVGEHKAGQRGKDAGGGQQAMVGQLE